MIDLLAYYKMMYQNCIIKCKIKNEMKTKEEKEKYNFCRNKCDADLMKFSKLKHKK